MNSNLRDWVVTDSTGTDVKNTDQLKPKAHKTSAEKETNVTKQHDTKGITHGPGHDGARNAGV